MADSRATEAAKYLASLKQKKQVICAYCGREVEGYGRRTYCTDSHRVQAAKRRRRERERAGETQ